SARPDTSPGTSDLRPSVAVLPFDNRSKLDDDVYFVDGIHDDILTQLSKVSVLRVISRTSVEQFRSTKLPMKAIAAAPARIPSTTAAPCSSWTPLCNVQDLRRSSAGRHDVADAGQHKQQR